MSELVTVLLPWVKPPLLANDRSMPKMHARKYASALKDARWAVRSKRLQPITAQVHATLHYRPALNRRRDCDGIAPTLKPVLDALVHEGVLADDSWVQVTKTAQVIHAPDPKRPSMWVELDVAPVAIPRTVLAELAEDLLTQHQGDELSLDTWAAARQLVEAHHGPIEVNEL